MDVLKAWGYLIVALVISILLFTCYLYAAMFLIRSGDTFGFISGVIIGLAGLERVVLIFRDSYREAKK
jgi:hypothetical protein